jgi:hypothetical protein
MAVVERFTPVSQSKGQCGCIRVFVPGPQQEKEAWGHRHNAAPASSHRLSFLLSGLMFVDAKAFNKVGNTPRIQVTAGRADFSDIVIMYKSSL